MCSNEQPPLHSTLPAWVCVTDEDRQRALEAEGREKAPASVCVTKRRSGELQLHSCTCARV